MEEKRKLYKKISKTALEDAELAYLVGEEGDYLPHKSHHRSKGHHRSSSRIDSRNGDGKEDSSKHHSSHYSSSDRRASNSRRHHHDDESVTSTDDRATRTMKKKKEEMLRLEIESLDSTIGTNYYLPSSFLSFTCLLFRKNERET